ncbi:MAG: hypothetical protein GY780_14180 [bacterium]|nr:hypothetical protein [bacterium]
MNIDYRQQTKSVCLGRASIFTFALAMILTLGQAQAVIFQDGDFDPSQWQSHMLWTQSSNAINTTQANGGNPASNRSLYLYSSSGFNQPMGRIMVVELKTSAQVTPAVIGGINQIDYSEDYNCSCIGGSVLWGPALEQGGTLYIVPGHLIPSAISVPWTNEVLTGLTAMDFEEVDVNSATFANSSSHPDFSVAGGPVTFGFVRAKSFIAWTDSRLDNWTLQVNETTVSTDEREWDALKSIYR